MYLSGFNAFWKMQLANGDYVKIGGQTSHSETFANELIELNKKENGEFRVLLANKGKRSNDLTLELIVSDDSALTQIKRAVIDRNPRRFAVVRLLSDETKSSEFDFIINSFAQADDDVSRVTINLQSTQDYDVGVILVQFLDSTGAVFRDSFGDRFLVRE